MTEYKVTPFSNDPADVEAARIAERILTTAPSTVVLQRAQSYWAKYGLIPTDHHLRRWYEEEER